VADYSAKIRLELENEGVLKRLQSRLDEINETIEAIQKLNLKRVLPPQGGKFQKNPNKQALADAEELAKQLKQGIAISKEYAEADKRRYAEGLTGQLKLNNAVELYERRLKNLQRAGAFDVKARSKNIQAIQEQYEFGIEQKDVQLIQQAAVGLGRLLETQRELNRTAKGSAALKRSVADYNKQIQQLRLLGVTEGKLKTALEARDELNARISRNEIDRAKIIEDKLKRQIQLLKQQTELVKGVGATSPISGRIGSGAVIPDSPADKARTAKASESWKTFLRDLETTATVLKAKALNTKTAWNTFFEDAAEATVAIKATALNTRTAWNTFFEDAAEAAVAIKAKALNTRTAWNTFFEDAAEATVAIKAKALNTKTAWNTFFEDAAEAAVAIKAKALNTKTAWDTFFEDAAEATVAIKATALNTRTAWNTFFEDAAEAAVAIKAKALNTQTSWIKFFEDAAETSQILSRRVDEIRRREGQASFASRGFRDPAPFDTGGVVRRTIATTSGEFFRPGGAPPTAGGAAIEAEAAVRRQVERAFELRKEYQERLAFIEADFDTKANFRELNFIQKELEAEIDKIEAIRVAQKKADDAALKDFDKRLKARTDAQAEVVRGRKKRNERLGNVALGAGFPLLFGGGPGAVLGGGLGGLGTGPQTLAAQIALSALGQQLDLIAGATLNTARSLTSTSKAFDLLQEKTLFSSEAAAEKAIQLEAEGKAAELATLLSEELANALGNKAAQSLIDLGKTTNETTELWNKLTLQLQTLLAGPLNGLLKFVNSLISQISGDLRFRELSKDLAEDAEFQAAVKARRGGGKTGVLSSADKAELLELFKDRVTTTVQIPLTAADRRLIAPPSAKSAPKGPKDRTAQLLADLKAIEAISDFENQIRDAQFEYNDLKVIDLRYKKTAADIERDTVKQLLDANYETEKAAILKIKDAKLRDAELVKLDAIRQLERDITDEYYRRAGLDTRFLIQRKGAGAFDTSLDLDPNDKAIEKLDEYRKKLDELVDPVNNAANGAEAIGTAFNSAFTELITGTTNAQEVLANFFRDVGKSFVDMAGKIISQLLIIYAYKSLLGIFGGGGTGLFTGEGPVSGTAVFGAGQAGFNPAAFTPGLKFAEGGYVTGPTRALIGEGGESEYVIPASKMKLAMNRYAAGARGNAVLSGGDETSGGGTATMAPAAIDVRYNVERINNVDYVTNQEFQAGLQQAASQGAERGQQLALRRLQQSVTTRRRLGI